MSQENWANLVRNLTAEYLSRFSAEGPICAEFAARPEDFDREAFSEVQDALRDVESCWRVHPCSTCVEHHGEAHVFHWEIEYYGDLGGFSTTDNYLTHPGCGGEIWNGECHQCGTRLLKTPEAVVISEAAAACQFAARLNRIMGLDGGPCRSAFGLAREILSCQYGEDVAEDVVSTCCRDGEYTAEYLRQVVDFVIGRTAL